MLILGQNNLLSVNISITNTVRNWCNYAQNILCREIWVFHSCRKDVTVSVSNWKSQSSPSKSAGQQGPDKACQSPSHLSSTGVKELRGVFRQPGARSAQWQMRSTLGREPKHKHDTTEHEYKGDNARSSTCPHWFSHTCFSPIAIWIVRRNQGSHITIHRLMVQSLMCLGNGGGRQSYIECWSGWWWWDWQTILLILWVTDP